MLLSVIICTRNRASEIAECLPGLAEQAKQFSDVEVLVVDNGSTDNTKETVQQLSDRFQFPFRYVFEPIAGLCQARNRGAAEAQAEVLAYIDDDERIGPNWIAQIREFFKTNKADSLGGKIEVTIEGEPPMTIAQNMMWFFGQSSLGDKERFLQYPSYPQGGNFAVRKKAFEITGGFDTNLKLYGDETEFFRRFSAKGFTMYYDPKILVTQSIPANRLVKEELKIKSFKWGEGSGTTWMIANKKPATRLKCIIEYTARTGYMGLKNAFKNDFGCFYTYWYNRGFLKKLLTGLEENK